MSVLTPKTQGAATIIVLLWYHPAIRIFKIKMTIIMSVSMETTGHFREKPTAGAKLDITNIYLQYKATSGGFSNELGSS